MSNLFLFGYLWYNVLKIFNFWGVRLKLYKVLLSINNVLLLFEFNVLFIWEFKFFIFCRLILFISL